MKYYLVTYLVPLLTLTSCGVEEPPIPNVYYGCTGTQICAYDKNSVLLGEVINYKILGSKTQLEIKTLKGYTVYLDQKGFELTYNYKKYQILTQNWPIKTNTPNSLGIFPIKDFPATKTTFNFTTDHLGGFISPTRFCYDGSLKTITDEQFMELARDGEDKLYPGVYKYDYQDIEYLNNTYIPISLCDKEKTGLSNYIVPPILYN